MADEIRAYEGCDQDEFRGKMRAEWRRLDNAINPAFDAIDEIKATGLAHKATIVGIIAAEDARAAAEELAGVPLEDRSERTFTAKHVASMDAVVAHYVARRGESI